MQTIFIEANHPLRSHAESFIAERYSFQYGATVSDFAARLCVMHDQEGVVHCAAGLRFAAEGFFCEQYLDAQVQTLLQYGSAPACRDKIFEVATLASRAPRHLLNFVAEIVRHGEDLEFDWSIFTLTQRLHDLLAHSGATLQRLGPALAERIADVGRWGSYYETRPQVFALQRSQSGSLGLKHRVASHV